MGVSCCTRIEDPEYIESQLPKIIHPINSYVKDDIILPVDTNIDYYEETSRPNNIPDNAFHLRVYASYDESIFPIWIDVGTTINFFVTGTWWLFNGDTEITSEGVTDNVEVYGFPLGCLLGHVQGGPVFEINNKTKYVSKHQGYLMRLYHFI